MREKEIRKFKTQKERLTLSFDIDMSFRGFGSGGGGGGGGDGDGGGGRCGWCRKISVLAFVLVFFFLRKIRAGPCFGEIRQFIQCAQSQHDIMLCNKVFELCRLSNLAGQKVTLRETYELTRQTLVRSRLAHYNKRPTITPKEIQTEPGFRLAHYNKRPALLGGGSSSSSNNNNSSGIIV